MKYIELKQQQSKELNDFPMVFAFSDNQFEDGLAKLSITEDEACSVPGGGFIRKTDSQALMDLFLRHGKESDEAMKDPEFAFQAFNYELSNHEFCITCDVTDTLNSLGLELAEVEADPVLKAALIRAKKQQPRG